MGNLERHTPQPPARSTAPNTGTGRDLDQATWGTTSLDLALVGLRSADDDPHTYAAAFTAEAFPRRNTNGSFRRRRVAWAATPSGIQVITQAQPITRTPDGRLRSSGPYAAEADTHQLTGITPSRRTGDVPRDNPAAGPLTAPTPTTSTDHPEARKPQFRDAHDVLSYLPEPVRRSVMSRIPTPDLFLGRILRYDQLGRYTVDLLRLDQTSAIALHASTYDGSPHWHVEQATYEPAADQSAKKLPAR